MISHIRPTVISHDYHFKHALKVHLRPYEINNKSSAVAEMGDRSATIGMGRKCGVSAVGAASPLGPHLTQCGLGRGLPLYEVAS